MTTINDKRIEAYLDGFDEFCEAVMERHGTVRMEGFTIEAMISLYRGFLTALPAIEKANWRIAQKNEPGGIV